MREVPARDPEQRRGARDRECCADDEARRQALARGEALFGYPAHSWAAIAGAALVSQLGGVTAIVWALRYLPATVASVSLLGQPVVTALLGAWLLGESLAPGEIAGGAVVLAGIAIASRSVSDGRSLPE